MLPPPPACRIAPGPARRTLLGAGFAVLSGAVLSGCAPGRGIAPLPEYQPQAYSLGGGDQIRVITFGEDQLTGEFRIDDQGRIALPLLGGTQAAGLTTQQLEERIGSELKRRNLLRSPSVAVEVIAYRPVFVLGEVAKPGQYPYQPGMTMLTAIAIAGGFTYRAYQDYAFVVRTAGGGSRDGLVLPREYIAPGDVVRVYERRF